MAMNTTKVWHTAAYIRLSREDMATRNGERAESESVVNQQQIIGDFIASQPDLGSHQTFIDHKNSIYYYRLFAYNLYMIVEINHKLQYNVALALLD